MSVVEGITLALAFAGFALSIGNAIVLRHRMRDRVDIVVTHRSLPEGAAQRTAIRAADDTLFEGRV